MNALIISSQATSFVRLSNLIINAVAQAGISVCTIDSARSLNSAFVLTGKTNFQDRLLATLDSCIHLHYASTVQGNAIHNGSAVVQGGARHLDSPVTVGLWNERGPTLNIQGLVLSANAFPSSLQGTTYEKYFFALSAQSSFVIHVNTIFTCPCSLF